MNRKDFLKNTSLAFGAAALSISAKANTLTRKKIIIPPYLQSGDTIGITCPAGHISLEEIQPSIEVMQSWGLKILIGETVGKKWGTFGGTDQERIDDFEKMLRNTTVKAIMCARGGYGIVRIIDAIHLDLLEDNPKWIIGFSDVTVLHSHINSNQRIATIHSKMCNSFPDVWQTAEKLRKDSIISIQKALFGEAVNYNIIPNSNNIIGIAEAEVIGGNLRTLENLDATISDIQTKGKILFLEEVEEPIYNVDRMFWNLKRTGKLAELKGLIIGGFKIKPDDSPEDAFGLSLYEIISEKTKEYNYPICFDFPVGHQVNNFAIKCGVKHRLSVSENEVIFKEI
jgi:muramoyltetrapeptide carboxypeptidase